MSLRHKWLMAVGASLGVLVVAVVLLYRLVLPTYVDGLIRKELRQRGLKEATFSLKSVGFSHMDLRDIRLDHAQTMTAGRIEVDYDLADLIAGRVREVHIADAKWHVEVSKDYQVNWGAIAGFARRDGAGPPPVRRVRWSNVQLVVETPIRTVRVPCEGAAILSGDVARFDLRGQLFGEELQLRARAHVSGQAGLLSGQLQDATGPPGQRNWLSVTARVESIGDERAIDLDLQGYRRSLRVPSSEREWSLANLTGTLNLSILGDEIRAASGNVSAASLSSGDIQVLEPQLIVERESNALALELSGHADQLHASLRGELSPRAAEWTNTGPFRGAWNLSGPLPHLLDARLKAAGVRTVDLRVRRASGSAVIEQTARGWRAEFSDARAVITGRAIALPAEKLVVTSPRASLRFAASVDEDGGEIALQETSEVSLRSLRWRSLEIDGAAAGSPALGLGIGSEAATFRWNRESRALAARELRARVRAEIRYAPRVHVHNLRGSLRLSVADGASPPDARIRWSRLRADALRVGDVRLPDLTIRLRGRPAYLTLDASSRITNASTLTASTTLDRRRGRTRCPTRIELPPARVRDDDRMARLIRGFVPVSVAGRLALAVRADPCAASMAGEGELRLSDVTAKHIGGQIGLFGIDATLAASRLMPVETKGWQELVWRETQLGEQRFQRGSVLFRSQSPGVLEVQQVKLDLGDGGVWTSPFVFAPRAAEIETILFASKLELEHWLPIISGGKARGSGALSGYLGINLKWKPRLRLSTSSGRLRSEGPGHFAVEDRSWLRSALARHSAGFGLSDNRSDLVKDRLIGALLDFEYSKFDVSFEGERPGSLLRVAIQGKGRQIPQELDLTLNVRGYQELINPGLRAWLANRE